MVSKMRFVPFTILLSLCGFAQEREFVASQPRDKTPPTEIHRVYGMVESVEFGADPIKIQMVDYLVSYARNKTLPLEVIPYIWDLENSWLVQNFSGTNTPEKKKTLETKIDQLIATINETNPDLKLVHAAFVKNTKKGEDGQGSAAGVMVPFDFRESDGKIKVLVAKPLETDKEPGKELIDHQKEKPPQASKNY